jgi:hypothetical protein
LKGCRGQPGDNSRPPLAALASRHGVTPPTSGQRESTAATASANADRACAGGTGSTPASTSSPVKKSRTASARDPNRRSQPRTVPAGRPIAAAIGRTPFRRAFAASAAPITSATSAHLSSANAGRSTWVAPHPRQRARRDRSRTGPRPPHSTRGRVG